MTALRTPRQKVLAGCLGLLLVAGLAAAQGASAPQVARVILGLSALAGMGWWFLQRRRPDGARFELPPRLQVVCRAGLSQRCSVALIEADGRSYLVAFGDGFAEIRAEEPPAAPAHGRRPRPRRRPSSRAGGRP